MRAYRFRLANVARIRTLEEQVARERLLVASRERRRAEQAEVAARAALAAFHIPSGVLTSSTVVWCEDQAARLSASVDACRAKVSTTSSACIDARHHWRVAAQRAEALSRLREQSRRRWRADVGRQEAAELDEMASSRHMRAGGQP